MLLKIGLVIVIAVVVFCIVAALQPSEFRTARSIGIKASPSAVFAEINDLHHYAEWNPWSKADPNIHFSFSGTSAGVGSALSWDGNKEVGAGSMTIVESRPNELVRTRLDFARPFRSTAMADFVIKPDGDLTLVTWTMSGQRIFVTKAIGLVINMDKIVGEQFEKGLSNLKARSEAQ